MELKQADLDYFARGTWQNPQFWRRFGGQPDFSEARVLDVGCGHGSMVVYVAQAGAAQVVGLDLNCKLIEFANANLEQNYPELASRVTFLCQNLSDYPEDETFDYIISKDSFEHIIDLRGMLQEMKKRLKPGGRIYAGFGPLYNSPFGDHDYSKSRLPWRHLMLGEQGLVARVNRRWKTDRIQSLHDLGLNGLALADYERIFAESGLTIVDFRPNSSEKFASKLFALPARIRPLREYFTFNIYIVLEKPAA
jgi:SAM-dependent methyltransferase